MVSKCISISQNQIVCDKYPWNWASSNFYNSLEFRFYLYFVKSFFQAKFCFSNFFLHFQSLVLPEKFQHILRVMNTNIDGKTKIMYAMTSIKGVGRRFSNICLKKADIDMNKRAGELSDEEVERLITIMQNPRQYKIPDYFLNRKKDIKDGKYSQVSMECLIIAWQFGALLLFLLVLWWMDHGIFLSTFKWNDHIWWWWWWWLNKTFSTTWSTKYDEIYQIPMIICQNFKNVFRRNFMKC